MGTISDKNYIRTQFLLKIHEKSATEFQIFFSDIMDRAFFDFQKIKPQGRKGDAGNDGYIPSKGSYYQVYAPERPNEREAAAAKKCKEDFDKLSETWDKIAPIRTYYFVYNDKGGGSTLDIEEALSELKTAHPEIDFKLFTPKELESVFFSLKPEDMVALGFDIDATKSIRIAHKYLDRLEIDIDRENGNVVLIGLTNFKEILAGLHDDNLQLEFELLEAKALRILERVKEVKSKYENLSTRYPDDPRAILSLAEYYINIEDFETNHDLLNKAKAIDPDHWLLKMEELIREYRLDNQIDVSIIDERTFPETPRIKSLFYRIYSLFIERSGDHAKAMSFIERAIQINPDKISNYDARLSILESHAFSLEDKDERLSNIQKLSKEIEVVEEKVTELGTMSPRLKATLSLRKINILMVQGEYPKAESLAKKTFELLAQCHFDHLIDKMFSVLLMHIGIPQPEFDQLLRYLQDADKDLSDNLANAIMIQYAMRNALITDGKQYFHSLKHKAILYFIDNLEKRNFEKAWEFLKGDQPLAISMLMAAREFPDLQTRILEGLPDDGSIQKEKLQLLLYFNQNKFDDAFAILKTLDLSNLSHFECKTFLEISIKKTAWEYVIDFAEKLLALENDPKTVLQLRLQLFNANNHIERYSEAIRIGEEILTDNGALELLDDQNKEGLLGQTIQARLRRSEHAEAIILLEKYDHFAASYDFKIAIEAEVYIQNKEGRKALSSVVAGITMLKTPTPEQYGSLFILFNAIGNLIDLPLTSLDKIEPESFVKFKNVERWYFVGDGEELDSTKIASADTNYSKLLNKSVGDKFVFEDKYRSSRPAHIIEFILPIEKYILWQCIHHAQELSLQHRWDKMEMIEVPITGKTIDPKYIIARLEEERKKRGDFFDLYCKENLPLAFLAVNEGGLTNSIGHIINENRGFIKFSSGEQAEIDQQKSIASRIISGEPFYIDGTSALMLSETGMLEKIFDYLPKLKIPQSVISMLFKIKEIFESSPGQVGHMWLAQGRLTFSKVDHERNLEAQAHIKKCIELLESKPDNIGVISKASKVNCFSEQNIPAELCEACILAQQFNAPVLTEDFFYLQANEIETGKKRPEYCSAFAIVRTLYEQKKISFMQYLEFFRYISLYRFRFLPITTADIEKAVFGDGAIRVVQPENIRYFNFPLTLSQEYGVPFERAFIVVGGFLTKALLDDTVLPEMAEKIFIEILSAFPTDMRKSTLGNMFLRISEQVIDRNRNKLIVGKRLKEKIDSLSKIASVTTGKEILLS